jgi:hypothetical protein
VSETTSQFQWVPLDPGEGVILRCRPCGAWAHTRDLEGYQGSPGYLIGDAGYDWKTAHKCDPERVARVREAGDDPANAFGRVPFYNDEHGRTIY